MSKVVMLAHPYDEDKHAKKVKGWYISTKYDGVRGFWDGEDMLSRNSNVYTLPDFITKQLKLVLNEDGSPMILDGEIWFGNDTFAIASGSARKFDNDPEVWKQMTYMVFDAPDTKIPFEERIKKLSIALKKVKGKIPNIKGVKHIKFDDSKTTIAEELTKVEESGGEGLVLRKPGSLYVYDRTHDMLKVKSWSYKEAEVTGYLEGTGRLGSLVGSLAVKSNEFGDEDSSPEEKKWVTFKVGSGLNDWQRYSGIDDDNANWKKKETQMAIDEARRKERKIHKQDDTFRNLMNIIQTEKGKTRVDALHRLNELYTSMPCIGDVITFRFKELTKDGNPLFPTFVGVRDYE